MVAMQAPSSSAVQQSVMSANFNSTMLFTYLMASNRDQQHRTLISVTITILFVSCACIFALQWRFMEWVAITSDGETRPTIFIATMSDCPLWAHVIVVTLQYTLLVVSDGLLFTITVDIESLTKHNGIDMEVFPCVGKVAAHGRSPISVPFSRNRQARTRISLAIIGNVPAALLGGPIALLMDRVQSAALFVSFFTTTITTALIGYRIYNLSKQGNNPSTKSRVKHITKILLESSTIYCIVLLVNAIVAVIPSASYLAESPVNISSFYVQIVLYVVSGLAPTIVVARIALANSGNSRVSTLTTDMSGMHFEGGYVSQMGPKIEDDGTRTASHSVTDCRTGGSI
ncbi:LOW QUALITY PROTEIN: hypothetical protein CVT25_000661 [Psilocybe cyanescens]|uniref:G-protein coupled receptors family 1 profile domain-containing protein n=1 Tax=Psilocybe cyanescens TaxID=93625 RepID=A0A409WZK2_PSICY|nr:LOW QUALITY PROTEIN: hypothetical protein CVT25_000661 [Psilocybe cyanescens]